MVRCRKGDGPEGCEVCGPKELAAYVVCGPKELAAHAVCGPKELTAGKSAAPGAHREICVSPFVCHSASMNPLRSYDRRMTYIFGCYIRTVA